MKTPMTPEIIGKIVDRSVALAVVCIISWLFWGKMNENDAKIALLETEFREYVRKDHAEAKDVIQDNTRAVQDCARALDRNSLIIDKLAKSN